MVSAIPSAVIGGLLFVIGVELVQGRIPDARLAWRAGHRSMILFLVTLTLTLTVPLQWGVLCGAVLSLLAYVGSSAKSTAVQAYRRDDGGWFVSDDVPTVIPTGEVTVVRLAGEDFFADVPTLVEEMPSPPPHGAGRGVLVLDLRNRETLASTSLKAVEKYHADNATVMTVLFIVLGAKVLGAGISTLARPPRSADRGRHRVVVNPDPHAVDGRALSPRMPCVRATTRRLAPSMCATTKASGRPVKYWT